MAALTFRFPLSPPQPWIVLAQHSRQRAQFIIVHWMLLVYMFYFVDCQCHSLVIFVCPSTAITSTTHDDAMRGPSAITDPPNFGTPSLHFLYFLFICRCTSLLCRHQPMLFYFRRVSQFVRRVTLATTGPLLPCAFHNMSRQFTNAQFLSTWYICSPVFWWMVEAVKGGGGGGDGLWAWKWVAK